MLDKETNIMEDGSMLICCGLVFFMEEVVVYNKHKDNIRS
jgi:hypothetical protein